MAPRLRLALAAASLALPVLAQDPPDNGPRSTDPAWHAFRDVNLVPAPGQRVPGATVVVRDRRIVAAGAGVEPPAGARVWDCTGMTMFAGLLDAHVPVDTPAPAEGPGRHWNDAVRAQVRATGGRGVDDDTRHALRGLGFAAAALAPRDGIFRGLAAVTLLADPGPGTGEVPRWAVVRDDAYHAVALSPRGFRDYPGSLMGAIALVRQTLIDADWRLAAAARPLGAPGPSDALDALNLRSARGRRLPFLFDGRDELDNLRALAIADEFGLDAIVLGCGTEFRRLPALPAGVAFVLPLDFPAAPDVDSPQEVEGTSLRELMTWEQAPTNPKRLRAAGHRVALTSDGLEKRAEFAARVREAIAHGLEPEQALAMLTTVPAALLGVERELGTIEPGKLANLLLVEGDAAAHPFDDGSKVREVWVAGQRHEVAAARPTPLDGELSFAVGIDSRAPVAGTITFAKGNEVTVRVGDVEAKASNVERQGEALRFVVSAAIVGGSGMLVMGGRIEDDGVRGVGTSGRGLTVRWRAWTEDGAGDDEPVATAERAGDGAPGAVPDELPLPFGAFGAATMPPVEDVVLTGATLWTCTGRGVIERGALWLRGGKIAYVGDLDGFAPPPGAAVIDASGRHLTPGLIDCHSHTGISGGVNEGTQACTAEVRIGDVVNPDDVNWYRQLAGGLTAVNQLHGSANPIGGQNSVVKLRWGCTHPDDMAVIDAPEGIKLALGENVKRSRSREEVTRYPRTRLGVEAFLVDRFEAAREYDRAMQRWRDASAAERASTPPPRRDLELEALAEILRGERLVHCHSYRQDEILMLCRVARRFGFRIGTFQHVLEGFKVAEAIAASAIGASSFSDWWAYKFEVFDAIPHNGALLHRAGVNVSFNSDSSELARRMNTEAAKAVKYGGVDPHEALAFVALNPAIQLGVQHRMGSLQAGKDADVALWSGSPLSTTARCEATWVDGRRLFSLQRDAALREHAAAERERIVQKLLARSAKGKERRGRRVDPTEDEAGGWFYGCGECGCLDLEAGR